MIRAGWGPWCAAVLVLVAPRVWAQGAVAAEAAYQEGKQYLATGRFSEAEDAFSKALSWVSPQQASLRAGALFGRAMAVQQLALSGGPPNAFPDSRLNQVTADYGEARQLDSATYYAPVSANTATLLRRLRRHEEALALFRDAAATTHPARAYFLLSAAQECETLERWDSAAAYYERALAAQPGYPEARRGLLDLYVKRGDAGRVVALATAWSREPDGAPLVSDALLALLAATDVSGAVLDTALLQLARNDATANMGPDGFERTRRAPLGRVAELHRPLREGVRALLDVYRRRGADEALRPPAEAPWWRTTLERRRVWSTTLRSLGDWYNRAGAPWEAARYYEAALGLPGSGVYTDWVDLDALTPLAVIYAEASGGAEAQQVMLDEFIMMLFEGKAAAYQKDDMRRVREFHMALGTIYARRGQWVGSPRGAIFQLEHMRRATLRLFGQTGQRLVDPPELLESLVQGYLATNQTDAARRLAAEVAALYRRLGIEDGASRMERVARGQGNR